MSKDYYEILGVGKGASKDEIKSAYRKLAHQHHPDKKGGDEKKFKEINEAYQILGDDQKRRQYDQFGQTFSGQSAGGPGGGWSSQNGFGFDFSQGFNADLGDIFEDFLGGLGGFGRGTGRSRRAERGSDIAIAIDVPFQESIFGGRRSVVLERSALCDICRGSGGEPGASVKTCNTCSGTGTVRESRRSLFGSFTALSECTICKGRGEAPERVCKHCRGSGTLSKRQTIDIDIPSGIRDGEAIKLTGLGEELPKRQAGDLYVRTHVLPHHIFRREGADLLMDLQLPISKMLLGGEESIETLEGKIIVKIPELSKTGDFLRLRGKGVPRSRGQRPALSAGRGDLLIRLFPKLPKKLTPNARRILAELEREGM